MPRRLHIPKRIASNALAKELYVKAFNYCEFHAKNIYVTKFEELSLAAQQNLVIDNNERNFYNYPEDTTTYHPVSSMSVNEFILYCLFCAECEANLAVANLEYIS